MRASVRENYSGCRWKIGPALTPPERLTLKMPPIADCGRYDALRTAPPMETGCHAGGVPL
jgi:hypothetical protein